MGLNSNCGLPEIRLSTRNTFLEYKFQEVDGRKRSFTDGAITSNGVTANEVADAQVQVDDFREAEPIDEVRKAEPVDEVREAEAMPADDAEANAAEQAHQAPRNVQKRNHRRQPRSRNAAPASRLDPGLPSARAFTTVMIRNLPVPYTRDMLVEMLNSEGFFSTYCFVYLPVDFKTHLGLGYAFVDFRSAEEAKSAVQCFEGYKKWAVGSDKVCCVAWSHPEQQGHVALVERYRNSPIMHDKVPDSWKPALFAPSYAGMRLQFPAPTKKLREPRIRTLPEVVPGPR